MAVIRITFTEHNPAPAFGYVVKYREVGTLLYTTVTPNPTSSPVDITVLDGKNWEGTVQAHCDNSTISPAANWTANTPPSGPTFNQFEAAFSATEFGVCNGPVGLYWSPDIPQGGDVVLGASLYFDSDGLNSLGDGFIKNNSSGLIYSVTNGIVGPPTGSSC